MNNKIKAGVAALLAAGSVAATAAPANAYGYHGGGWGGRGYYGGGWHGGYYRGGNWGGAAVAGIAGLALGAALASPHYGYGYYGHPYYGPYYGGGYCLARQTVWDPYLGGYVVRRVSVPC